MNESSLFKELSSVGEGGPIDVAVTNNGEESHLEDELCVVAVVDNMAICLPRLKREIDEHHDALNGQLSKFGVAHFPLV